MEKFVSKEKFTRKEKLLVFATFVTTAFIGDCASHTYEHYKSRKRAYAAVVTSIDTNNDGKASIDEWTKVYETLGIEFNPLKPTKLTTSDLEKYLMLSK